MNENDLQGFANFIDSLYNRPTDDSWDKAVEMYDESRCEDPSMSCKWCDEPLTDYQVERGDKLCSRFCTQEYYGEDFNEPIL